MKKNFEFKKGFNIFNQTMTLSLIVATAPGQANQSWRAQKLLKM